MKPTRNRRRPSVPVDWSCKEHRVKAPATCGLCRDQLPLFEVPEQRQPAPPAPEVSEAFRRRVDAATERRRPARVDVRRA